MLSHSYDTKLLMGPQQSPERDFRPQPRSASLLRAKKDEAYEALHSLMMRMEGRRANASRVAAEIKEGASIHAIDSCALDVYGIDHRSPDNLYKVPKSELPRLVRSLRRLIAGGRVSAQQKEYYIVCQKTFEREIAQLAQLEASAKRALQAL